LVGSRPPRIVVLGDLMVDVVLAPASALRVGTDVPGRVALRQGGSAATTARWLARLGARSTLVCSIGRDHEGRELVAALEGDGVRVRANRVAGERTGRIGVVVAPGGERSFVADRAAADTLAPADLRASTFRVDLLHLPAYSLLGEPLGLAGRRAIELARAGGALVSLDLSSVAPLLADGRRAAIRLVRDVAPDVLFATRVEAEALIGGRDTTGLGEIAAVVVIKQGRSGASVLARSATGPLAFDVATTPLEASDSTGAGDAFDAGFLVSWLTADASTRVRPATLRRAVTAAHRAAARQLSSVPRELAL
jgi:sugar/nucleoside kinase (ribokinase family)